MLKPFGQHPVQCSYLSSLEDTWKDRGFQNTIAMPFTSSSTSPAAEEEGSAQILGLIAGSV